MANKKNNDSRQNMLFLIDDKGKMIVNPNINNTDDKDMDENEKYSRVINHGKDNLINNKLENMPDDMKEISYFGQFDDTDKDGFNTFGTKLEDRELYEKYQEHWNKYIQYMVGQEIQKVIEEKFQEKIKEATDKLQKQIDELSKQNEELFYGYTILDDTVEKLNENISDSNNEVVTDKNTYKFNDLPSETIHETSNTRYVSDKNTNKYKFNTKSLFSGAGGVIGATLGGIPGAIMGSAIGAALESRKDNIESIDFDDYKLFCYAKILLENKRISQRELSIAANIPQSTLNGILNNTMPTSLENAFKISKILGVKIEEIFEYRKSE